MAIIIREDLLNIYRSFEKYWGLGKEEVLQEKIREAEAQLEALRGE